MRSNGPKKRPRLSGFPTAGNAGTWADRSGTCPEVGAPDRGVRCLHLLRLRGSFRRRGEHWVPFGQSSTGRTMELYLCPQGDSTHGPDQALGFFGPAGDRTVRCGYCQKRHPVISFEDASRRSYIVTADTGYKNLDGLCMSVNQIADAIFEAGLPRKASRPQAVRARA